MDGSLWMESHLKADGPKCVVLAFLCCPDPYYCLILDSQFSLFFLFFWLMIWLNLCGFVRFGEIRRGRFNFWMLSRVHKWPPMVLGSLLGKRTIQHTLVHQLSGKDEVFHGLLFFYDLSDSSLVRRAKTCLTWSSWPKAQASTAWFSSRTTVPT